MIVVLLLVCAVISSGLVDERLTLQAKKARKAFLSDRVADARHYIGDRYYNVDYDYDPASKRYLDVEMVLSGFCGSELVKTNHKIQLNLIIWYYKIHNYPQSYPEFSKALNCFGDYKMALDHVEMNSADIISILNEVKLKSKVSGGLLRNKLVSLLDKIDLSFTTEIDQLIASPVPGINKLFLENLANLAEIKLHSKFLDELLESKQEILHRMSELGKGREEATAIFHSWINEIRNSAPIGSVTFWSLAYDSDSLKVLIEDATPSGLNEFPWVKFKKMLLHDKELMYFVVNHFLSSNVPIPRLTADLNNKLRDLTSRKKEVNQEDVCTIMQNHCGEFNGEFYCTTQKKCESFQSEDCALQNSSKERVKVVKKWFRCLR